MLHHDGEEGEVHGGNPAPGSSCPIADVTVMGCEEVPHHLNGSLSYLVAPGNRRGEKKDRREGKGGERKRRGCRGGGRKGRGKGEEEERKEWVRGERSDQQLVPYTVNKDYKTALSQEQPRVWSTTLV